MKRAAGWWRLGRAGLIAWAATRVLDVGSYGQEPSTSMDRPAEGSEASAVKDAGRPGPNRGATGLFRDLQELKSAVDRRDREDLSRAKAEMAKAPLPHRPSRTVTPPTLSSADVDRLLSAYLKKTSPKVDPASITSDVEFARRAYLDIAGVTPTPEQLASFVRDKDRDKRDRLVDGLLQTPEYARNWASYWKDVIRFHATNPNAPQVRYELLEGWLADRFRENRPWDEIARGLITATGRVDENGATSFGLAHEARPVELAGEVSRIFLAVQIQCAQCHDHKTDSWKREQFHEFAAFFSGTRAKPVQRGMPGQLPIFEVAVQGRPRYAMPDLKDPAKQTPVAPKFFLASARSEAAIPRDLAASDRRELGASYVTGQDNPWFARAFVNRMWYVLVGESFYDAVDDIGPGRTPKAPEVIEALADQWQKGGYDVRWLIRTITGTRAYQRRIRPLSNPAGRTSFAANCPSRLRSDQIVAALSQALGLPNDLTAVPTAAEKPGKDRPQNARRAAESAGLGSAPTDGKKPKAMLRLGGPRGAFNALFGFDPSAAIEDINGTIPQALFLMNGPIVHNRTQARPNTVLGEILSTCPDDRAALNALYMRVLCRQPTAGEVDACAAYMGRVGRRPEAFEDIYWALINSTEFITRR